MDPVRNSAKAIIVEDNRLLVVKHIDAQGEWHVLPGGGQNPGETLKEALQRECLEEVGIEVLVGALWFVREYIGRNHEFWQHDGDSHQVEFMFECQILKGQPPAMGSAPDPGQLGCVWLPMTEINDFRLYPMALRELLDNRANEMASYLGDVN